MENHLLPSSEREDKDEGIMLSPFPYFLSLCSKRWERWGITGSLLGKVGKDEHSHER